MQISITLPKMTRNIIRHYVDYAKKKRAPDQKAYRENNKENLAQKKK